LEHHESDAADLLPVVAAVTRPIGVLRIMAAREGVGLAFQRTLRNNRIRRFLRGEYLGVTLDIERLLSTLLQNSHISLTQKDDFVARLTEETERCSRFGDDQIIHGKDFVAALASIFSMLPETMEALVFACIDIGEVRRFANIQAVENWIRERANPLFSSHRPAGPALDCGPYAHGP